jgi:hypothetical protein
MTRSAAFIFCLFWFGWSIPALACPEPGAAAVETHALSGRSLWSPKRFMVRAGGEQGLIFCDGLGWGHVRVAPDFMFDLTRMGRYRRLHLRSNAPCDTVLLLRDPLGRWFFDDDSGVGQTASLSLAKPVDGAYLVWVGSYQPEGCVAQLTLETF